MCSEGAFRDDKSGSFDLHASHHTDAKRLDTLLLAIAIVVRWICQFGERLLREERRKEIDPTYGRQLSVFLLGWRLLGRLLSCATPPSCTLLVKPFRPELVWQGKLVSQEQQPAISQYVSKLRVWQCYESACID